MQSSTRPWLQAKGNFLASSNSEGSQGKWNSGVENSQRYRFPLPGRICSLGLVQMGRNITTALALSIQTHYQRWRSKQKRWTARRQNPCSFRRNWCLRLRNLHLHKHEWSWKCQSQPISEIRNWIDPMAFHLLWLLEERKESSRLRSIRRKKITIRLPKHQSLRAKKSAPLHRKRQLLPWIQWKNQ